MESIEKINWCLGYLPLCWRRVIQKRKIRIFGFHFLSSFNGEYYLIIIEPVQLYADGPMMVERRIGRLTTIFFYLVKQSGRNQSKLASTNRQARANNHHLVACNMFAFLADLMSGSSNNNIQTNRKTWSQTGESSKERDASCNCSLHRFRFELAEDNNNNKDNN